MKTDFEIILERAGLIKEAGYSGWSKSNNAVEAEEDGKFPASVAAKKLGVSTKAIEAYIPTSEWHHYSSHYNKVYVYDITPFLMLKNNEDMSNMYDDDEIEEFKQTYQQMKDFTKKEKEEKKSDDGKKFKANVEYIEWTGTRNRPKPIVHKFENIWVKEKGQYYTFILPNGKEIRKMKGSNGTVVQSMDSVKEEQKQQKERQKIIKERFKTFKKNTSLKALRFMKNNNLDPNSSYTTFYVVGRKPSPSNYNNLKNFLNKGELRLCSKNKNIDGLTTGGAYLEQWNGERWVPIEDNNPNEEKSNIGYREIQKLLGR